MKKIFLFLVYISSLFLAGCNPFLDSNVRTQQRSDFLQERLAKALIKLDTKDIEESLLAGANPYDLKKVANVNSFIPSDALLSPYGILLEGYLKKVYLEENIETIREALNELYSCIEFLIKKKISVDYGVITFNSNPTFREYIQQSRKRLEKEKVSPEGLDEEGKYALKIHEKIDHLINEYQSNYSSRPPI